MKQSTSTQDTTDAVSALSSQEKEEMILAAQEKIVDDFVELALIVAVCYNNGNLEPKQIINKLFDEVDFKARILDNFEYSLSKRFEVTAEIVPEA